MSHVSHNRKNADFGNAFRIGIFLNIIFIIVEVIYGLSVDSLSLIADAGHNLGDVFSLGLAWIATFMAGKSATGKYTYGYKKSTILAAFLNAMILLIAVVVIVWEATGRIAEPRPIQGITIMLVAGAGVLINTITALLFYPGRKGDLNIKGAFLHMGADAAVSFGVVIVGLVLTLTNLYWLDPAVSIAIAVIIFVGTWELFKDSVNLALDAVPKEIDKNKVEHYFDSNPEILSFHDLHIWAMSTTETALTVHARVDDKRKRDRIIEKVSKDLKEKFNIVHTTIQTETGNSEPCSQNKI